MLARIIGTGSSLQEKVVANQELETMVDYNEEALQKVIKELELMDEDRMIKAENAIISEYSEKDGYKNRRP